MGPPARHGAAAGRMPRGVRARRVSRRRGLPHGGAGAVHAERRGLRNRRLAMGRRGGREAGGGGMPADVRSWKRRQGVHVSAG